MAKKAKKLAKYSDLQEQLGNELPINAARLKFIVLLITALIKVQSVNFERLAQGFDNEVKLSSNLRRIQRFFAEFDLSSDLIAQLLFKLLPFCGPYRLTLDRTNWKYGQTNINILVLGVIYKGLSLPILWTFLGDKRGNSDKHIEFLIVASYTKTDEALSVYRQRWQIETMFKAFKTTGFNLEDTHLTDYQRLDKLLMLKYLAFIWAYKQAFIEIKILKKLTSKNMAD